MKFSFELSEANTVFISIEKIMYGAVLVRITQHETDLLVSYTAMADGGDVCSESTNVYSNKAIAPIVQHILDTEFPDSEHDEASYSWAIQIGDNENQLIAERPPGYWESKSMLSLDSCLEEAIGKCDAITALVHLIEC